jgi:1,4-alpha-glucan branching enzyme
MIRREDQEGSHHVKVTFVLGDDKIDGEVAVVGDFNGWDPTATPLRHEGGQRTASTIVEAGKRYAFRYFAEGRGWFNDEAADDYEPNEYGGSDSIVDLSVHHA